MRKRLLTRKPGEEVTLDPRFVLTQLWHHVAARNLTDCQVFVDRGGLSYALVALSSRQVCVRKLAYSLLQRFYRQLESLPFATFKDRQLWLNFLDMLRSCLTQANQQLRRLRTSFYTNCVSVIRDPSHPLFADVRQLLLKHATIDEDIADDVVRLLASSHPKSYREAALWALTVMLQGIDEKEDFDLLNKRLAFDRLIDLFSCETCSLQEKQLVLNVMEKACKIKEAAMSLCSKAAVIPFLNDLAFDMQLDSSLVAPLIQTACTVCDHCFDDAASPARRREKESCQLLLSLTRHASRLTEKERLLVRRYVSLLRRLVDLLCTDSKSSGWLLVCQADLKYLKTLEECASL